jgi:hypothetical protein
LIARYPNTGESAPVLRSWGRESDAERVKRALAAWLADWKELAGFGVESVDVDVF